MTTSILQLNQPLALAYHSKEDLRQIWRQEDKASATAILQDWVVRTTASGIPMPTKSAKTLGPIAGAPWPPKITPSPPALGKGPTTRSKP